MVENKLKKKCPFCGAEYSNVKLIRGVVFCWVECLRCGERAGECLRPEDAVKVWNQKVSGVMEHEQNENTSIGK